MQIEFDLDSKARTRRVRNKLMGRRLILILLLLQTVGGALAQDSAPPTARRVVFKVNPAYPDLARRMHLSGIVRLRITIAPNGSVRLVEPVGGNPVLLKAAQDAVSNWKYAPAPGETSEVVELRFDAR
jgi:TonB family protein